MDQVNKETEHLKKQVEKLQQELYGMQDSIILLLCPLFS
jgi:hypothetical protein